MCGVQTAAIVKIGYGQQKGSLSRLLPGAMRPTASGPSLNSGLRPLWDSAWSKARLACCMNSKRASALAR